jgi:hypothetical protein
VGARTADKFTQSAQRLIAFAQNRRPLLLTALLRTRGNKEMEHQSATPGTNESHWEKS